MGRRTVCINVGAIRSSFEPEWLLAVVFDDIEEECNLLIVEKTDTLNFGGYGVEVKAQMETENIKKYQTLLQWKMVEH